MLSQVRSQMGGNRILGALLLGVVYHSLKGTAIFPNGELPSNTGGEIQVCDSDLLDEVAFLNGGNIPVRLVRVESLYHFGGPGGVQLAANNTLPAYFQIYQKLLRENSPSGEERWGGLSRWSVDLVFVVPPLGGKGVEIALLPPKGGTTN